MQSLLPAIHLLAYSTLLGSTLYQSFVMIKVCYNALPASAFTSLQKKVFPVYFRLQSLLLLATALTYPPHATSALALVVNAPVDAGLLAFAGATAVANWLKYGPATSEAMVARTHQETRDGRKHDDPAEASEEMRVRKRAISRNHAMSIHLNLLLVGVIGAYGVLLASRMRF